MICCLSEQVCPREIKITYGCHGDRVVWVIILYGLCFTDDYIFQIIFGIRCGMERSTEKNKINKITYRF